MRFKIFRKRRNRRKKKNGRKRERNKRDEEEINEVRGRIARGYEPEKKKRSD